MDYNLIKSLTGGIDVDLADFGTPNDVDVEEDEELLEELMKLTSDDPDLLVTKLAVLKAKQQTVSEPSIHIVSTLPPLIVSPPLPNLGFFIRLNIISLY